MEEFRRSKSSSTLGKTDALEIQELPNGSSSDHGSVEPIISEATTPEPQQLKRARDSSIVTLESAGSSDNLSQYLDKDEKDREENVSPENEEKENIKPAKEETPGQLDPNGRSERAKSEEPKRKRKLSIDSSYSRISLSKLGVLKKLRDAKEKIKVPKLSFKRKLANKKTDKKDKTEETKPKEIEKPKKTTKIQPNPDKPVYIHIPLKPPPGETDEFSYLEFEDQKTQPSTSKEPDQPESTPDSPAAGASGVQFIVLTPPSDDEILEDAHIPDTPSEGEKFFDSVKIEDLKTLAKDVVDGMEAKSKRLATVEEDKENGNAVEAPQETTPNEQPTHMQTEEKASKEAAEEPREEKMIIDEEDGLRSSEVVKIESSKEASSEDASTSPISQVAEKRKSFRKKAKKEETDRIYEDVQVPQGKTNAESTLEKPANLQPTDVSQSMSVDEEKTYLDEKIIKTTSLEEDYNKWSKTK